MAEASAGCCDQRTTPWSTKQVSISVKAASDAGFDEARIENGVLEPLRELGLIDDTEADR